MAAVGGLGWERSPPPGTQDDTAANTDTDSDTDSDTDPDTDSDTDSDTDADCSAVPVCGGDPTGFWSATDVCPDTTQQPIEGCDGGYTQVVDGSIVGTLEFSADSSYLADLSAMSMTLLYHLPTACLSGATCAQLEATTEGGTCVDASDGCDCTVTQSDTGSPDSGMWSVDGDNLTVESSSGSVAELPFCVDGNSLWLSPAGTGGLPFTMVFSK